MDFPMMQLTQWLSHFERLAYQQEWGRINALLKYTDPAKMLPEFPLAAIRSMFLYRKLLTEWAPLRDRLHADLTRKGKDADSTLVGLYRDD